MAEQRTNAPCASIARVLSYICLTILEGFGLFNSRLVWDQPSRRSASPTAITPGAVWNSRLPCPERQVEIRSLSGEPFVASRAANEGERAFKLAEAVTEDVESFCSGEGHAQPAGQEPSAQSLGKASVWNFWSSSTNAGCPFGQNDARLVGLGNRCESNRSNRCIW